MKQLALRLPVGTVIDAPSDIPTGGFTSSPVGNDIVSWAIGLAFALAVVAALIVIVWGGLQWVTSRGDKEQIAKARSRIIYALVGLIVLLLSVAIINLFLSFFNMVPQNAPYYPPCEQLGQPC